VKDEKGETVSVVFVEAKKGKGILTREELLIKKAVVEEKM
jgi:predicted Holliday junction resolvase-like endonuclease